VRKAERGGLRIEFSSGEGAMSDYYTLHCLTRQRHGTPPQPFAFFANLRRHVLGGGAGQIVSARHGDRVVASAVFLHRGRHAIYKFGASDDAFQGLRANNLVMWSAIAWYAERGYETFDFGRTDTANEGLRRFKRSWGTAERRVRYFRFDLRRRAFVAGRPAGGWSARLVRRLPRPIARMIGLALYRHAA
jgi:lipid II:glycine glycyltransferase (peptidoglycan interpeptide bridge formation enzyme)